MFSVRKPKIYYECSQILLLKKKKAPSQFSSKLISPEGQSLRTSGVEQCWHPKLPGHF